MSAQSDQKPRILPLVPPAKVLTQGNLTTRRSVLPTAPIAPMQRKAELELVIQDQDGGRYVHPLNTEIVKIGRRRENDVVLSSPQISGFHAEIRFNQNGDWELIDCRSFNGTMVNGKRVAHSKLQEGDMICFGEIEARVLTADPENAQQTGTVGLVSNPEVLQDECRELREEHAKLVAQRDAQLQEIERLHKERTRAEELATEVMFHLKQEQGELERVRAQKEIENQKLEALLAKLTKTRQEATLIERRKQALLKGEADAPMQFPSAPKLAVSSHFQVAEREKEQKPGPPAPPEPPRAAEPAKAPEQTKPSDATGPIVLKGGMDSIRERLSAMREERQRLEETRGHQVIPAPDMAQKSDDPVDSADSKIIHMGSSGLTFGLPKKSSQSPEDEESR